MDNVRIRVFWCDRAGDIRFWTGVSNREAQPEASALASCPGAEADVGACGRFELQTADGIRVVSPMPTEDVPGETERFRGRTGPFRFVTEPVHLWKTAAPRSHFERQEMRRRNGDAIHHKNLKAAQMEVCWRTELFP